MSKLERESRESNTKSKYDNLNNNELKFKQKNPSNLINKEYSNKEEMNSESSNYEKELNLDYRNHRRRQGSRSRSRSYSRKRNSSRNRHSSYREDKKHSEHHHHHHHRRHKHSKRHHRDHSSRKRSNNRYRDEEEESMRRHLLKTNSINAFLQGKSSNIFYDDNYLPLSSNPYKYLGKPGLEDNNNTLDLIDEIPISESDISKKDIELYVINLPRDLTEDQIKELLNTALKSIEANDKVGDPIISVTKGKKSNYFILEFRTANECKNAMKLNGMKILERTLKIGQPNYNNEKNGNNINFNGNNGVHDLFPILSSFEKEFDYKKGIDNNKLINNTIYNYQNLANNLLSGQNILYNSSSLTSGLSEQKLSQSIKEKIQPEPGTKLHIMNLPNSFDENDIITLFKKFGKIRRIELLNDEQTNKFNGQCYLEYEKEKSYQDAINYGTGLKLGDNFLLINRINIKDNNKLDGNKINLINPGNYKSKSSLGILASSINLGSIAKQ